MLRNYRSDGNVALDIINEMIDQEEFNQDGNTEYHIDSDEKAEKALNKISEERADAQRIINVCKSMIVKYQEEIKAVEKRLQKAVDKEEWKLMSYFEKVPHKRTKTQETYRLPSGTLKMKYPEPEYIRDEKILGEFLHNTNYNEYYETVHKPKWGELKGIVKVHGDKVVDEDNGLIIEGVKVVQHPPEFVIEV